MPHFRPIGGITSIDKKHRNLPHWQFDGCTYFITFRLADSIPKGAIQKWQGQQKEFLSHYGVNSLEELTERQRSQYRKLFGKPFHKTLDQCHGACLLKKTDLAKIVESALHFFDGDRYHLGDYVIMPNHVHILVEPEDRLEKILHSWKSFSAKEINKSLRQNGQVWQDESYDHIVRSKHDLDRIITYIAANPAKANLSPESVPIRKARWTFESL